MKLLFKLLARAIGGKSFYLDVTNPASVTVRGVGTITGIPASLARTFGLGVGPVSYFSNGYIFADMARESQVTNFDGSTPANIDANYNPNVDFRLIYNGGTNRAAAGTYKIKFNGQADITTFGGGTIQNKSYSGAGTNITTADLVISSVLDTAAHLSFANTKRTNASATNTGVTNIRVFRPGYPTDDSVLLTTEFVSAMSNVNILRLMDFVNTNGNNNVAWADRRLPAWRGQATLFDVGNGQSWEVCVALANACNRDLWINVPVKSNDTYITNLANLIRYGSDGVNPYTSVQSSPVWAPLNSNLNLYLEYGNETWNFAGVFKGYEYTLALGQTYQVQTGPVHPINHDGKVTLSLDTAGNLARLRWHAYRSAFISLAFRSVFGDAAMMTRVRPVLESQLSFPDGIFKPMLLWLEDFYGATQTTSPPNNTIRTVKDLFYGGGGSAYYNSSFYPTDSNAGTMTAFFAGIPNSSFISNATLDSTWVKSYGLKYVAYEGGSNGAENGDEALSKTYNNDSRYTTVIPAVHAAWEAIGGDELVYYVYSGVSDNWSHVNNLVPNSVSDTATPKMLALAAIKAGSKATVTTGSLAPCGTPGVAGSANAGYLKGSTAVVGSDNATWKLADTVYRMQASNSDYVMHLVRSAASRSYTLSFNIHDSASAVWKIYVNGISVGQITIADNGADTLRTSPSLTVALEAGLNAIRVKATGGAGWIRDIVLV